MILNALFLATVSAAATVAPNDVESITVASKLSSVECHPHMVYIKDNLTCICNDDGRWPHPLCHEKFGKLKNATQRTEDTCTPNGYITIECNVCRCNAKGGIDYDRCTKNICNKDDQKLNGTRRSDKTQIYGTCEAKRWYSMAPCQYCYCSSTNKLLCSTATDKNYKVHLGTYTLTRCSTDLKHDMEVLFQEEKLRRGNGPANESARSIPREPQTEPTTPEPTTPEPNEVTIDVITASDQPAHFKRMYKFTKPDIEGQGERWIGDEDNDGEDDGEDSEDTDIAGDKDRLRNEVKVLRIENDKEEKKLIGLLTETTTVAKGVTEKKQTNAGNRYETYQDDPKWNFPTMLENFIKLAMRKAMMTLRPNTRCEPGSQFQERCNRCFCMKNGKVLCTTKICEMKGYK